MHGTTWHGVACELLRVENPDKQRRRGDASTHVKGRQGDGHLGLVVVVLVVLGVGGVQLLRQRLGGSARGRVGQRAGWLLRAKTWSRCSCPTSCLRHLWLLRYWTDLVGVRLDAQGLVDGENLEEVRQRAVLHGKGAAVARMV